MTTTEETGMLTDLDISLEQRTRAIRVVASAADDAADCGLLLEVLGLSPQEARD